MIDQIQNVGSLTKVSGLGSITTDATSSTTTTVGSTPGSMTGVSFASVLGDMANSTVNNLKRDRAARQDRLRLSRNNQDADLANLRTNT